MVDSSRFGTFTSLKYKMPIFGSIKANDAATLDFMHLHFIQYTSDWHSFVTFLDGFYDAHFKDLVRTQFSRHLLKLTSLSHLIMQLRYDQNVSQTNSFENIFLALVYFIQDNKNPIKRGSDMFF